MIMSEGSTVRLRRMTADDYEAWRLRSIEEYAKDYARATGRTLEDARARSAEEFEKELPDGVETEGKWVFIVENLAEERVGVLWLGPHPSRPNAGFVFEIKIDGPARRQGYGRAAMLAAEDVLRSAGMTELGLTVFGFNEGAQDLYKSIGYEFTTMQMRKQL